MKYSSALLVCLCSAQMCFAETVNTGSTKIFSEPVVLDLNKLEESRILSSIVDTVFVKSAHTSIPSAYKFSELYGDYLYSPINNVRRANYPSEGAEIKRASALIFERSKVDPNRFPHRQWRPEYEKIVAGCIAAAAEAINYKSRVRIYNYVVDTSCIMSGLPGSIASQFQIYSREIVHGGYLIHHGALEKFATEFDPDRRHAFNILNKYNAKIIRGGVELNVVISRVSVVRPWYDETFWRSFSSRSILFLRNEYSFSSRDERSDESGYCFIEEIDLICNNDASGACRIEGAQCASIPSHILGDDK